MSEIQLHPEVTRILINQFQFQLASWTLSSLEAAHKRLSARIAAHKLGADVPLEFCDPEFMAALEQEIAERTKHG